MKAALRADDGNRRQRKCMQQRVTDQEAGLSCHLNALNSFECGDRAEGRVGIGWKWTEDIDILWYKET